MPYFQGFQQSYARFFIPFLFGQRGPQVPLDSTHAAEEKQWMQFFPRKVLDV